MLWASYLSIKYLKTKFDIYTNWDNSKSVYDNFRQNGEKMDYPLLPRTKGSFIMSIIWIILIINKLQVLDSILSWVFIVVFFEIRYIPE